MKEMLLLKGTVVKFGCLSTSLYTYLRNGISIQENESKDKVIRVGELIAYEEACKEFCSQTMQVHNEFESALTEFVKALQNNLGERPAIRNIEEISAKIGLPIIIEIEVQEDCVILNDDLFDASVDKSWKIWRSIYLKRDNGIPASWLKNFYFPRLIDYKELSIAKSTKLKEQTVDCALMVGGLMQSWHKDTPGELLVAFHQQYGRTNFSQKMEMNEASVERFFNLNAMLDPATRILNQVTLWQDINSLAQKQEICIV